MLPPARSANRDWVVTEEVTPGSDSKWGELLGTPDGPYPLRVLFVEAARLGYMEVSETLLWESAWASRVYYSFESLEDSAGAGDHSHVVDGSGDTHAIYESWESGPHAKPEIGYKVSNTPRWSKDVRSWHLADSAAAGHSPMIGLELGSPEVVHAAWLDSSKWVRHCERSLAQADSTWSAVTSATDAWISSTANQLQSETGNGPLVVIDESGAVHFFGKLEHDAHFGGNTDSTWMLHAWGIPSSQPGWAANVDTLDFFTHPADTVEEGHGDVAVALVPPSLTLLEDEVIDVAWVHRDSTTGRDVYFSRINAATGDTTTPVAATPVDGVVSRGSSLAHTDDGRAHLIYMDRPLGPQSRIFYTSSDDPSTAGSWGPAEPVTPDWVEAAFWPSFVMDADTVLALFQSSGATAPLSLWFRKGVAVGTEVADGDSATWSGTVYLDQDFVVEPGGTLTIEPGTRVMAKSSQDTAKVEIVVQGTLTAEGEANDPIHFGSTGGEAGDWGGLVFQVEGSVSTGYGYIGSLQPVSRIEHATIEDAMVGVRIKDLCAPGLSDVTFSNIDATGGVARHIFLDSTDVVLPFGNWDPVHYEGGSVEPAPVVWSLEAPTNVVATNGVASGKEHPWTGSPYYYGHAGKVDLFSDGEIFTDNESGPVDYVRFRPEVQDNEEGDGWGGLQVHWWWGHHSEFRYADVGHAVDGIFFVSPGSCVVENSRIHHYANYGIRTHGSHAGGVTVSNSLILRGDSLAADKGIWGIYAERALSLRVLDSQIYDYSYGQGDDWTQPTEDGGGIRIINSASSCGTTLPDPDSVVVRGNALVGPGETFQGSERNGIQLDWACGKSAREVVVDQNGIIRWYHGLKVDQSRDTDVRCNRVKDNRTALEFFRNTSPTSDPEVRFKENQLAGSAQRTVFVDEGMEKLTLGAADSTTDRGLNRILVDNSGNYYVTQWDSTFSGSDSLQAHRNQWHDGVAESTRVAVIGQCEPTSGPNRDRIALADTTLITGSYSISCLASTPDTLAPDLGGIFERTVAPPGEWVSSDSEHGVGALAADEASGLPAVTELTGVWPNPVQGETRVRFAVGRFETAAVRLAIFDVTGRRVVSLLEGRPEAGWHEVSWSGRDSGGRRVAAGVYFLRFEAGSVLATRKIVHLR
jgi:hypothetical protein